MVVRLEYSITEAEGKEAQALHLTHHYGKGSKRRAQLVQAGFVAIAIVALILDFFVKIDRKDWWWFLPLLVVFVIAVTVAQRVFRSKKKEPPQQRVEIAESGLVFISKDSRTAMVWAAFCRFFESPNLFVLLDRSKRVLFIIPKRAFPEEAARDWFRTQAGEKIVEAAADNGAALVPETPGDLEGGIKISVQLKFRDYLNRTVMSWRIRGIILGLFLFMTGLLLFMPAPKNAVVPPMQVFGIMMLILFAFVTPVLIIVQALQCWWAEKRHSGRQEMVVTGAGIIFSENLAMGKIAWNAYEYYLENRWAFFVWKPRATLWFMVPKRGFESVSDIGRFRELLRMNLKNSRWFYY